MGNISLNWKANYKAGKIMALKSKQILFKVKEANGRSYVAKGKLDFLESKYKEPKKLKDYNFERFTSGISDGERVEEPSNDFKGNFNAATKNNDVTDFSLEDDPITYPVNRKRKQNI